MRSARHRRAFAALLVAFGLTTSCSAEAPLEMAAFAVGPPETTTGGFEVVRHGLAFANYASQRGFTVADAVTMFGDEAVCGPDDGACVLDARAAAWIDTVSASMSGGVCEGMVLFALDRFVAGVEPFASQLVRDEELEARIGQLFATQFLPGVGASTVRGSDVGLADVVRRIEAGLAPGGDPVTVGVYDEGAGHALLPVALERLGDDRVVVAVYDVNWPGSARALEIDLGASTWRYSIEAVDQVVDPAAWVGDEVGIDITPLSARADLGSGPFVVADGRSVLTATFRGDGWSVSTDSGRIDAGTALPGHDGVLAVGRGARGTTTVVLALSGTVSVVSSASAHLAAATPAGWMTADSPGAAEVEFTVEGATSTMRVLDGELSGSTATASGVVDFPGRAGVQVTIEPAAVVVESEHWGRLSFDQPRGERTDWTIADDGSITADTPPRLPSSVRGGQGVAGGAESTSSTSLPEGPTDTVAPTESTQPSADSNPVLPTTTGAPTVGSVPASTPSSVPSTSVASTPPGSAPAPTTSAAPTTVPSPAPPSTVAAAPTTAPSPAPPPPSAPPPGPATSVGPAP